MIKAVVGILQRADKMLIAERPVGKPYSGYWEFPGGKIEQNETSKAALKRELFEELDIVVTSAQFICDHVHAYPDKTVFLEIWRVTNFRGEPISKENQLLRWASFSELLTMPLLEGNWPIIEKLKNC